MAFKIREAKEDPTRLQDRRTLFRQQRGKCSGCGFAFEFRNLQVDHIVPVASGGADRLENLQLLCAHCNYAKGERSQEHLSDYLRKIGITAK